MCEVATPWSLPRSRVPLCDRAEEGAVPDEKSHGVVPPPIFSMDENFRLESILDEFPDVLTTTPGRTDIAVHYINTGDSPPIRNPIYRLSPDRQ